MKLFRIEHELSGMGPYEHGGQIEVVVCQGIRNSRRLMDDIDLLPSVREILARRPDAVFGFTSLKRCQAFVRNPAVLRENGFVMKMYQTTPLYVHIADGQVLFLKDTFSQTAVVPWGTPNRSTCTPLLNSR